MSFQIAIIRRVRSGCETEFQQALRDFFQASFAHRGVLGASMIVPAPDSGSREYGILRTFADEAESEAFYASALFKNWDARVRPLTEGEPVRHPLHGFEAWFRAPGGPPPRWKMALVTFAGVVPLSLLLTRHFAPMVASWPWLPRSMAFNALMVAALTWAIMPFLTRLLQRWLTTQSKKASTAP